MRGVNKVILIGNATRDAELRHTHSGKPVASIRLATHRLVRTAGGERQEESQFHSIVCWECDPFPRNSVYGRGDEGQGGHSLTT